MRYDRGACPRPATAALAVVMAVLGAPATCAPAGAQDATWERGAAGSGDSDPLASEGDGLEDVAREADAARRAAIATRGPVARVLPVGRGEVLVAPMGVREVAHEVEVTLAHGLASVEHRITFASSARHAAEARYRLATPDGARLAELAVCDAAGACRHASARGAEAEAAYEDSVRARPSAVDAPSLPVARARMSIDARGAHVDLAVAPVPANGSLTVRVRYLADAPLRAGRVSLTLPERGRDARTTASQVRVRAPGMLGANADGFATEDAPLSVDAWMPVTVGAHAPSGGPPTLTAWRATCGERETCVRVRAAAGPRAGEATDLIVLVDASPSTEGAARARIGAAVASLLAAAPRGTRVRAVAFAARAEALVAEPIEASALPLSPLAQGTTLPLGASTRIEAALEIAGRWLDERVGLGGRRPTVVLVGDGGLTASEAAARALMWLSQRSTFFVIEVSGRGAHRLLAAAAEASGGAVVDAARAADASVRGAGDLELAGRVGLVFAPVVAPDVVVRAGSETWRLGPVRAGEERVVERVVPTGVSVRASAGLLAATAQRAPAQFAAALGATPTDPAATVLAAVAVPARPAKTVRIARRPHGPSAIATPLGAQSAAARVAARGPTTTDACTPHGPPHHPSGVSTDAAPVALAAPRACALPPGVTIYALPSEIADARAATSAEDEPDRFRTPARRPLDGRGVPAETVLAMLRTRLVPAARACLREDRAGRADHAVRAVLVFRMEDREITRADVEGDIAPALRACLRDALDRLDVPRFEGAVMVRYPIYTEGVPPPPTVELDEATASELDRVVGRGVSLEDVRRLRGE